MGRTLSVPSVPDARRLRRSLRGWYKRVARDLPWRRTREPYEIWVSEVMLQQTTVAAVLPYYERFLARFPDVQSLARSNEEELLALWSGLGYYRRARNLREAAKIVLQRHKGRFPSTLEEIRALPGLGRYSAGAIASICFGLKTPAVDGNVSRVISRIFGVRAAAPTASRSSDASSPGAIQGTKEFLPATSAGPYKKPWSSKKPAGGESRRVRRAPALAEEPRPESVESAIWRIAAELVPADRPGDWTQALMELGARICKPASPDCPHCPVARDCRALAEGTPTLYPAARSRPRPQNIHASLVAVLRRGRVLLVRRDGDELLGGLWELPGTLTTALANSKPFTVSEDRGDAPGTRVVPRRTGRIDAERGHVGIDLEGLEKNAGSSGGTKSSKRRAAWAGTKAADSTIASEALRTGLGFEPERLTCIGTVRHAVTHRRVSIEAWRASAPSRLPAALREERAKAHRWADPRDFGSIPIGAASRKVLAALGIVSRASEPRESTIAEKHGVPR